MCVLILMIIIFNFFFFFFFFAGSMFSVKSSNVVGGSNMQYGTLATVVFLFLTFLFLPLMVDEFVL